MYSYVNKNQGRTMIISKKKTLIAMTLAMTIAGCATYKPIVHADIQRVTPNVAEINTVYMGDPLISQGYGYFGRAIITTGEPKKSSFPYSLFLQSGAWESTHESESDVMYAASQGNDSTLYVGGEAFTPMIMLLNKKEKTFCVTSGLCATSFTFEDNHFFYTPRKLAQSIIYIGNSKSELRFSYRELIDGMARPAFNVDFSIDINESKEFGFKGALFEVVEATNTKLTYKIIKPFS
jgi:hypothetical protein